MREVATLLLRHALGEESGLFEPEDGRHAWVKEAGEWCQSTPGTPAPGWLGATLHGAERPGRGRDGFGAR